MSATEDEWVTQCAEALVDPASVVLVGAGGSAEAKLPTWWDLLDQISNSLPGETAAGVRSFAKRRRYLEAAELARLELGDESEAWKGIFEQFDTRGMTTSVWSLVASLGLSKMVTTNWDNIASDSFAKTWNRTATTYVGIDRALQPLQSRLPHIIHIHGKVPEWDTIVFSKSQYDRVEIDPCYESFWVDLLVKRPLLIVGFSGDDPAFLRVRDFIKNVLKIGHLVKPFVILPRSRTAEAFGGHSSTWFYDDDANHDAVKNLLRLLRDKLNEARRIKNIDADPFVRAGIPPIHFAKRDVLLSALAGVNLRMHCGNESFLALTILIGRLGQSRTTTFDDVVEHTIEHLLISQTEAQEVVQNAIEVARDFGWVTATDDVVTASANIPRVDESRLNGLIAHVHQSAQGKSAWNLSSKRERYIKDALLAYWGNSGGRAANTLLGLETVPEISSTQLRLALAAKGLSIGETPVEEQICRSAMAVIDDPPQSLEEVCGRLAHFALVSEMVSHPLGRDLLREKEIERLYLDTNIVLPAIAPGHKWHTRCVALIDRARRHCAGLWFLEGFAEELEVHFTYASELANEIHDPGDFYEHALLKDETNGFLDAFINWSDRSGHLATFKEYCEDSGLSAPIKNRVRGIGITIAEPRRFQGAHYEVAAKTAAAMGGQRRRKLAEHEGDQIAQLSFENAGKASVSSRFVTAHAGLRDFVVSAFPKLAPTVMLPVAFSQYLAAMSPSEIPPPSLRELAFKSPGIDIAQAVFGILISRYRADPDKLRKLGTEEVVAQISEQVSKLSERFRSDEGYDARRRLREIIDVESAPAIEKELNRVDVGSKAVIVPKAADEGPREAAKRMARELTRLKDTKSK